jgi:hypothetical protein
VNTTSSPEARLTIESDLSSRDTLPSQFSGAFRFSTSRHFSAGLRDCIVSAVNGDWLAATRGLTRNRETAKER